MTEKTPEPEITEEMIQEAAKEGITKEELETGIKELIGSTPTGEQTKNVHTFLFNVATADDTTKLGYLTSEEIGQPKLPIRTYKELALFCKDVANMDYFHDYFNAKSEIITSTSLSKDAKLIELAVVTKREVTGLHKSKLINKGWFKKKKTIVE